MSRGGSTRFTVAGALATVILASTLLALFAVRAAAGQTTNVAVDASKEPGDGTRWATTVPVKAGEKLKLTATGQAFYCGEDSGRGGCPVGPDGNPSDPGNPVRYGLSVGVLMGKFNDDGTPFAIGSGPTVVTVPADGVLEMGMDDSAGSYGIVAGSQSDFGTFNVTIEPLTNSVKGTVYGISCSSTGCSRSGLAGSTVLVTGQATDGTSIVKSGVTGADGTYAVDVPSGHYKVGPTHDGKTIDGAAFEPSDRSLTVAGSDVTGQDFQTCASSVATAALDRTSGRRAPRVVASAADSQPSPCRSIYTLTISAKIPQGTIVDPSFAARYDTGHGDGFPGFNLRAALHFHSTTERDLLQLANEYPTCRTFTAAAVRKYAKQNLFAEWYTSLKGGKLGTAKVKLAWDQKEQEALLVGSPIVTTTTMTRIFRWRLVTRRVLGLRRHRVVDHGTCSQQVEVPLMVAPVGGGNEVGGLPPNGFGVVVTWGFPFDPFGVQIDPTSRIGSRIARLIHRAAEPLLNVLEGLSVKYSHLPEEVKFGIDFAVSFALGSALEKAIVEGGRLAFSAIKAAKAIENTEALAKFGSIGERALSAAHEGHTAFEILENAVEVLGSAEYPVMSVVLHGQFESGGKVPVATGKWSYTKTTLGLAVSNTHFPNILVSIVRDAAPTSGGGDPFGEKPVFTGHQLPWASQLAGVPEVSNPQSVGAKTPGLLSDSTKPKRNYLSGKAAVTNIEEATAQNPLVTEAVHKYTNVWSTLREELDSTAEPKCDSQGSADSPHTVCWTFSDKRP